MPSVIVIPDPNATPADPAVGPVEAVHPDDTRFDLPPEGTPPGPDQTAQSNDPVDRPRPLHVRPADDWISLVGSALGSLALIWVLF
jgi:hypothetical protein